MFVTPVSEPEMKKLIMQLNDGAPGRDGVTAKSLKCITAFDTVTYDWFSSYLNERYQFVVYNGCESEHKLIQCGVTQWSILGPLPFLICINDLPSVSNEFMPILFADGTNLFCTGRNIDLLVNEIKDEMSKVSSWVKANQLSLNIDKTYFMLFTPECFHRTMGNIMIDGHPISEVK